MQKDVKYEEFAENVKLFHFADWQFLQICIVY